MRTTTPLFAKLLLCLLVFSNNLEAGEHAGKKDTVVAPEKPVQGASDDCD